MEAQVTSDAVFKQFREIIATQAQEIAMLKALIESLEKTTANS